MCQRCGGQMVRFGAREAASCLLCGWVPVDVPADVVQECEARRGLDRYGRTGNRRGAAMQAGKRL